MPALDLRREMAHIWDEYQRFQGIIGEEIIWFKFDTENSQYDHVYDEDGRTYLPGVRLNILWVDQIEDPEQYNPDGGRRPQQRIRFAVSARHLRDRGISTQEAHGRTLDIYRRSILSPAQYGRPKMPWFDDRLNDVIYYDKRFYSISNFQIRGRGQSDDVIIGISALEFIPDDESIWDLFPANSPWGGDYSELPADTGITLTPPVGDTYSITFAFDDDVQVLGTWVFEIMGPTGSVFSYTFPDNNDLTLNLDGTEVAGLDPLDIYEWRVTQTLGTNKTVVWSGDLIPVVGIIRPSREVPGEYDDISFFVTQGVASIWTLDTGLTGVIGDWTAEVFDEDGVTVASLLVITTLMNSHGLIGVYLENTDSSLLTVGGKYELAIAQSVGGDPADIVISGPLIVGEP